MKIAQIQIDVYFDQEQGVTLTTLEEVQQGSPTGTVENSTPTEEVHLDPDSADFEEKKFELKAAGYFFNRSTKTWRKKKESTTATSAVEAGWFGDATEIELSQDDPNFVAKKESLKSAGFRWDTTTQTWRKPKDSNGSRKSARHRVSKLFLLSAIAMFAGMS